MRFRPTVAEVDLEAIRHNVRSLKPPDSELMAVVKANGYGHGDVPVATAALDAGATWLGVALVEEGIRLRNAGIDAPILILSEFSPGSYPGVYRTALAARLTPTVYTPAHAVAVLRTAREMKLAARAHLKLDTGMHRVGLPPEVAVRFAQWTRSQGLRLEGVWTHFAMAEALDDPTTQHQLKRFQEALSALEAVGVRPRYRHAANSAATIALPETHFDLVRVGIAMYGISPGPALDGRVNLRPAMSFRSRVSLARRVAAGEGVSYGHTYRLERDSLIATVPVGYADGYFRALANRGQVLIRGKRHRVAGAVTMDQIMVDCGDDPVAAGDEVVLLGRQGNEEIRVEEAAGWIGTIGYEVVCAVSERVPREYRG